jgi:pre-mRNA-splicing factor 38A
MINLIQVIHQLITGAPYRYLRALAAFYIRLTFKSFDVYEILEPLMKDYRKLRTRDIGKFSRSLYTSCMLC